MPAPAFELARTRWNVRTPSITPAAHAAVVKEYRSLDCRGVSVTVPKPKAFMLNFVKRRGPGRPRCTRSRQRRTVIDGTGPSCHSNSSQQHRNSTIRCVTDFEPRARRSGCASQLLRAVAGALGAVLLAHTVFHRSAIASLAYTARGAPSIVDFDASPSAPATPVCSHVQGGRIPVAQAGWWWREYAAQAA